MTVAKAMAGGFPISGLVGKRSIIDVPGPGGMGGTYGGNPVACAAAHAAISVIQEENLVERSNVIGTRMVERLQQMKVRDDVPPMGDIRGLGAMVAFELVKERGGNEPNPEAVAVLTAKALEHGLILLACGYWGNSVRILAPLTIDEAHLEEGLDIIERCLVETADIQGWTLMSTVAVDKELIMNIRKKDADLPDFARIEREEMLRGVGLGGEAIRRPQIGVVSSWGEVNPGSVHLDKITGFVKNGIWATGGTPREFVISSICTSMAGHDNYHLPHRDLVARHRSDAWC